MSLKRRRQHSVTLYDPSRAYNGYTLFWNFCGKDAWLIDMQGYVVHRWKMPHPPALHGVLLPNGNLFAAVRPLSMEEAAKLLPRGFGGIGGQLIEADWQGDLVWKLDVPFQVHDFYHLDNGNTVFISWHPSGQLPADFAATVKGGIPGTEDNGVIWADAFVEVNSSGQEVWKWLPYEHMDPEIDVICPLEARTFYPYVNSIMSLPNGDILVSMRFTNTVAIIDKATGDIKWRWGPGEIAHQHDANMIDNGNILVFDNGGHRYGFQPAYSRIVEVNPASNKIVWEYKSDPPTDFYTPVMGGCQRLPNGNTLICESLTGRIFEVTYEGKIVWEFVNPFYSWGYHLGWINCIFRAHRYGPNYGGLQGRDLDPKRFERVNQIYGPGALKEVRQ